MVAGPSKMYLSEDLEPAQIDYLYSELTCFEFHARLHGAPVLRPSHDRQHRFTGQFNAR